MRNRPFVAGLSINAFLRVANVATRQAAIDTVKSGHSVFGLEKGQIVEYGPGHQSLPGIEEAVGSARQKWLALSRVGKIPGRRGQRQR